MRRHFRFTLDSGRIAASQRTDAMGHERTHAPQRNGATLVNHLVCAGNHGGWSVEAERFRSLEVVQ
jgi:hypothetical protein